MAAFIGNYAEVMNALKLDRIFSLDFNDGEFILIEECDEYFVHVLTKQEAYALSEMFKEIAARID